MIDPNWSVIDLDPVTWRNLGRFLPPQQYISFAQPGEHGLFILHDGGRLLNVVDTERAERPVGIPRRINDPETLARAMYERGEWDRVHVIDRQHLANVARQAQATPRRDLASDGYYHLVYTLMRGDPAGYACVPPDPGSWHGWTYADMQRFVAALPSPASVALGVYAGESLLIGLILVSEGGLIRTVTTFEGLEPGWEPAHPGPTPETLRALRDALATKFAPAGAMLLCTEQVFAGWIEATASAKAAYLADAQTSGTALWYLADEQ